MPGLYASRPLYREQGQTDEAQSAQYVALEG